MQTRAAAQRSTAAAVPSAAAAAWADLPPPLWEAIAAQLPTTDLLSLRQAWRAASELGSAAVRQAAFAALGKELFDCLVAASFTATRGAEGSVEEVGYVDPAFLSGVLDQTITQFFGDRKAGNHQLLPCASAVRCKWGLRLRKAGILMQFVVGFKESLAPQDAAATVDIEELRFLTPDGTLLMELGLASSLDDSQKGTCALRVGDGTAFGRLLARPLGEAPAHLLAHFEALRVAGGLRTAEGRWSDGLLLPVILTAVTRMYPLQL